VDLTRLMTDKSGSGEIYVVCTNFNYKKNDFDEVFEKLLKYIDADDNEFIIDKFDEEFMDNIIKYHYLLTIRRITNYNMLLFRLYNAEYAIASKEVRMYVKHLTDYYVNYYIKYIELNELEEE
jgi:hypothetical protein